MNIQSHHYLIIGLLGLLLAQPGNARGQTAGDWQKIKIDSLEEWSDPGTWWKAENGVIYADTRGAGKLPFVHYLIWNGSIKGDFELSLEYRILSGKPKDAGVNFRVKRPFGKNLNNLPGYQAELDTGPLFGVKGGKLFGHIHDGKRSRMFKRGVRLVIQPDGKEKSEPLAEKFDPGSVFRKPPEWNLCNIRVVGDQVKLSFNGVLANELVDGDTKKQSKGDAIALQFRPGAKYRFEVRDLKYKSL